MSNDLKKIRIIFTQEDKKTARKNIIDYRKSYIIDTKEMILQYDYTPGLIVSSPMDYIIQQEIEKKLRQAITNKKSKQVIYFHYSLNGIIINNIRQFFKGISPDNIQFDFVLYDINNTLHDIYSLFDEVIS